MNRKLKVFGLAAVAALAMSALAVSAAQANFTSANYSAGISAVTANDTFHAFGSTVSCDKGTFTGELTEESPTLTITPKYEDCTFGGFPATVEFTSCDYVFHTTTQSGKPEVSVECTEDGDEVDITIFGSEDAHEKGNAICHIYVPEQTGLTGHKYTNNPDGTVNLSGNVGGITATQDRTSFVCPQDEHTKTAEYTIQQGGVTVKGDNGAIEVH